MPKDCLIAGSHYPCVCEPLFELIEHMGRRRVNLSEVDHRCGQAGVLGINIQQLHDPVGKIWVGGMRGEAQCHQPFERRPDRISVQVDQSQHVTSLPSGFQ